MGTRYRGTAKEVRALDAFIKLARAARTLQGRQERRLIPFDLTENQFGVLEILLHLGEQTAGELSDKQFTSCGNVTLLLDNLERRGLIRRERSLQDRRSVVVHLTREGRELGTLTAAEQVTLGVLCKKLGTTVASLPERERPVAARSARKTATPRASSARRAARARR
jgi:MarR family transcriptional regulator, 2-MHQ and catechol-resistance regulon repressor